MWSEKRRQGGAFMATRAPLTEAEKEYISRRKRGGASLEQIAHELECSWETVRKWWRYARDGIRPRPRGRPSTGVLSTYSPLVSETAVAIKRAHPHWGPANVNLELKRQLGLEADQLPSQARLSALFKAECPEAVQPRSRRIYPERCPSSVTHPHQRWQVDGKEKVPVGDGDVVTILEVRDPVGALMIADEAFVTTTAKAWRKLTLQEVQNSLRQGFEEWGFPLEIQTDREQVYIGAPLAPFPSLFTLWLRGLGIEHIVSRERRPTDQAHVERNHRTMGDMAWKDEVFETVEQLQMVLDDRRHRHNHELPIHAADCQGEPPLALRPWARHSGRPFHSALEEKLFDLERVDAYLAQHIWTRPVSHHGEVSIGRHKYQVGCVHAGETVSVRFIPASRSFRFESSDGTLIAERPAVGLNKAHIMGQVPIHQTLPHGFQLGLPLQGV